MTTTRYFQDQVLRKRPYLSEALCASVLASPIRRHVQPDGRVRFWGEAHLPGEAEARILCVATLDDGITIHNAFLDRGFRRDEP